MSSKHIKVVLGALCVCAITSSAQAQQAAQPALNAGDTSWMLVSSLLVLMMSVPGLALFYGGLVKKDNVLATLMQTLAIVAIVSVLWPVIGYSLAFTEGSSNIIGGTGKAMLAGITPSNLTGTIPETVFIMFQMTFAAITTALLVGAVADRVKFSAIILFAPLWMLAVYCPVAHWVWGPGGFLGGVGVEGFKGLFGFGPALDFAGGTVVHINSGVAGLVAALVIGRRISGQDQPSTPANVVMSLIGTGLLWVGWFGFNAGSALTAGTSAGMAMLVTNSAAAIAGLSWIAVEWMHKGKPSVVGALSGVVTGLVAITPAAGFVGFSASLAIGAVAAACCYTAVTMLKSALKYDDSLDVFGIHGVGGIIGALLTGVFATTAIGPGSGLIDGNSAQIMAQFLSVAVTVCYTAIVTFALLKVVDFLIGLRVAPEIEASGLDMALHGESLEPQAQMASITAIRPIKNAA